MNILLTVFVQVFLVFASFHPIHVSVTEIEYDEKEKELEIMMRIFIDDLETAIRRQRNASDLDILHPPSNLSTKKLIDNYLAEHFKILLDGKPQTIQYLGQEEEGEAMVCYILVSNVRKWREIEITNSILTEIFDDQSNIVHVTVNGKVKSMRLVSKNIKGTFSF